MLILSLLLLPTVSVPAPASSIESALPRVVPQEDFYGGRDRLLGRLVKDLEELAEFCQKKRAFAQRNKVYGFLLEYDTDHKDARKTLGYKWDRKAEAWTPPKRPKTAKDADEETAAEAKQRYDSVLNDHRNRMVGLLEAHPELPTFRADEEVAKLIKLLPEDADLRRRVGQVKLEVDGKDTWVSEEYARTKTRRKELEQIKKGLNDDKPEAEEGPIEAWEADLGVKWDGCNETDRIRVVGTIGESERIRIAQQTHILWNFVEETMGAEYDHEFTVYIVKTDAEWALMINNWPSQDHPKEFYLQMSGVWMGDRASLLKRSDAAGRADGSVRGAAGMYFGTVFGINGDVAWMSEGFGLYHTQLLLGTRKTFMVQPSEYTDPDKPNFTSRLSQSDANWLSMCLELFEERVPPKLPFTLGRDVNQLTGEDVLLGYALTRFLIEGCDKDTFSKVAKKIGHDKMSSVEALESTLGYDIHTLTRKLQEWLIEVK